MHLLLKPSTKVEKAPVLDFQHHAGPSLREHEENIVRGPLDYLLATPGKDMLGWLISAFNLWLQVPEEKLEIIRRVMGLLHAATLLIDDIHDSSNVHRGLPVAHSIFGTAQTINSANYAYFLAQKEIQRLGNLKALEVFAEELLNLHRGRGMHVYWTDGLVCPTEEDFLEMAVNKTGSLFRLAVRLMQMESKSTKNFIPLANLLGIICHIRDDYQNSRSSSRKEKVSFLTIHSIRSNPHNMLKQKGQDDVFSCMESTGSFEYCRKVHAMYVEQARRLVDEIDGVTNKSTVLDEILRVLEELD